MFRSRDKVRPYTYGALMADLRRHLREVGADERLGPHGIRVRGYNDAKEGCGEDLTVAHGGWRSTAHTRYARFNQRDVLGISSAMLGIDNPFNGVRVVARSVLARGAPATVDAPDPSDGDEGESPLAAARNLMTSHDALPEGYVRIDRTSSSGRSYAVYRAPDGYFCSSRPHAWRHFLAHGGDSGGIADPELDWHELEQGGEEMATSVSPRVTRRRAQSPHSNRARREPPPSSSIVPPFPDDLSTHVVYNDRPSSRRAPVRA